MGSTGGIFPVQGANTYWLVMEDQTSSTDAGDDIQITGLSVRSSMNPRDGNNAYYQYRTMLSAIMWDDLSANVEYVQHKASADATRPTTIDATLLTQATIGSNYKLNTAIVERNVDASDTKVWWTSATAAGNLVGCALYVIGAATADSTIDTQVTATNSSSTTSISTNITTAEDDSLIIDFLGLRSGVGTNDAGADQTLLSEDTSGSLTMLCSVQQAGAAGTHTMSWTGLPTSDKLHSVISISPRYSPRKRRSGIT